MDPEPFLLAPCTPADIPAMVSVNLAAFAHDPIQTVFFPPAVLDAAALRQWMSAFLVPFFSRPEVHFYKAVDPATGHLAAWTRVAFPHTLSPAEADRRREEREQKLSDGTFWPQGANLQVADAKFGGLAQMREKYCDDSQTYYFQLLATDPAYQRRGLATKLLKHVLQMADAEGKPAYIEASRAGFPVYQKVGFEQVDVVEVDLSKFGGTGTAWNKCMKREPQPVL